MNRTKIRFQSQSEVTLEDFMGGDDRVCMSAWVSFGTDDAERLENRASVKGLINFLYRNQHMTPFESSVFTFRVKTPIFVAREIFRHRSSSFNEWSGRYSKLLPEFYIPTPDRPLVQTGKPGDYSFISGTNEQYDLVLQEQRPAYQKAWDSYEALLEAGVAKEVARNTLPVGVYTYFYVTINARNLMHFLKLRTDSHAIHEIQEVARDMESHLKNAMPLTYEAFKEYGV